MLKLNILKRKINVIKILAIKIIVKEYTNLKKSPRMLQISASKFSLLKLSLYHQVNNFNVGRVTLP